MEMTMGDQASQTMKATLNIVVYLKGMNVIFKPIHFISMVIMGRLSLNTTPREMNFGPSDMGEIVLMRLARGSRIWYMTLPRI